MPSHPRSAPQVPGCRTKNPRSGRRRAARGAARLFRPQTERMEDRTLLATMIWTNADGGDWDVATNWVDAANPGDQHVPTASDTAEINISGIRVTHSTSRSDEVNSVTNTSGTTLSLSSGTLSVAAASTISGNLTISGGTLTGSGNLAITGATTWTGGTMSGSGTTIAEGGLTLGSSTAGTIDDEILSGRTLENAGVATLSSLDDGDGLYLNGGATLENQTGASFSIATDAQIFFGGDSPSDGTVVNAGTFAKTGGTGTSLVGVTFNQTGAGTVEVQSGTLGLTGGGTISGTATAGISISSGAALDLGSGTLSLSSVTGIADAGTLTISGATVDVNASPSVAGSGVFSISSGTIDLNDGMTAQSLSMSGGTLTGPGDLTITGATTWTGGTMSGSGTTIAQGGLNLGGSTAGTTFNEILSGARSKMPESPPCPQPRTTAGSFSPTGQNCKISPGPASASRPMRRSAIRMAARPRWSTKGPSPRRAASAPAQSPWRSTRAATARFR